jgi:hypothetical protein
VATQKYTIVAAKAVSLAELFAAHFAKGLDGPVHFGVELSAPDGPSTGGGKQALQHIKIIPDGGGMAVVIGQADTTRAVAEIRTYEHVAALYAQRFRGAPIPVDVTRYYELGQALATFFRAMNMQVTFAELGGAVSSTPQRAVVAQPSGGRAWMVIASVVVGMMILAGAYAFIFLRR